MNGRIIYPFNTPSLKQGKGNKNNGRGKLSKGGANDT